MGANAVVTTWKKNYVLGIHKTNDAVGFVFVVDVFVFVVFFFAKAVYFIDFVYFKFLSMIKELLLNIIQFKHILPTKRCYSNNLTNRN